MEENIAYGQVSCTSTDMSLLKNEAYGVFPTAGDYVTIIMFTFGLRPYTQIICNSIVHYMDLLYMQDLVHYHSNSFVI